MSDCSLVINALSCLTQISWQHLAGLGLFLFFFGFLLFLLWIIFHE